MLTKLYLIDRTLIHQDIILTAAHCKDVSSMYACVYVNCVAINQVIAQEKTRLL